MSFVIELLCSLCQEWWLVFDWFVLVALIGDSRWFYYLHASVVSFCLLDLFWLKEAKLMLLLTSRGVKLDLIFLSSWRPEGVLVVLGLCGPGETSDIGLEVHTCLDGPWPLGKAVACARVSDDNIFLVT